MTNLDNYARIWGDAEKNWKPVTLGDGYLPTVMLVGSWIFMISFVVFAAFSVLSDSDIFPALMILSIFLWIGSGIAYIRFRRQKKRNF